MKVGRKWTPDEMRSNQAYDVEWARASTDLLLLERRGHLDIVRAFVRRVNEEVEERLAGGETAEEAYPSALGREVERLRDAIRY